MNDDNQLFADHRAPRPDVVRGKNAEFLCRQALKRRFDVFWINVFPFLCDNHVFLAAAQMQVSLCVEFAEVAGTQPTFDDGLLGEFWIVEVTGHDGLAAHNHFSDAVGAGIGNFNFHTWERFADSVRTKWL